MKITTEEDSVQRAKLMIARDEVLEGLKDFWSRESATGQVIAMWQGYEELVFNMSQADPHMKTTDFRKLSAYNFMRYKKLLVDKLQRNGRPQEDDEGIGD